MKEKQEQLAQLVAALAKNSQKATYTAVAGVVGLPARTVMQSLLKDPQSEWVVASQVINRRAIPLINCVRSLNLIRRLSSLPAR